MGTFPVLITPWWTQPPQSPPVCTAWHERSGRLIAGTMIPSGATQDRTLTLMHLRKMFSEYCKVPLGGSKDNEQKMSRMLPLFAKVSLHLFVSCIVLVQYKSDSASRLNELSVKCNFFEHLGIV
jgi:hypothetical protein